MTTATVATDPPLASASGRIGRRLLARTVAFVSSLLVLTQAGAAPSLGPWVPLFQGIDHVLATNAPNSSPDFTHLMVANALRIDLQDPDIRFLSSPRIENYQANVRETAGRTVSQFVAYNGVQAAINAGFFSPTEYYLPEGTPMRVSGLLISQGEEVSPANGPAYASALLIDQANHATIVPTNWPAVSTAGIWTAISGDYPVLIAGMNVGRKYEHLGGVHNVNPRTAVGLSPDRRYLYMIVIDGRQSGYSDGALDYETAAWLQLLGAHDGFNLDGGGSSTMSIEDSTGKPRRLNQSSAVADSGKERTVGGHLGVFAKPLTGFINLVTAVPDDDVATITWTTAAPATSQVEYGLSTDLELATAVQTAPTTNHAVRLTGLQPGSGYYFRAVSLAGETRHVSSDRFFTTLNYFASNQVVSLTNAWKFTAANLDGVPWTARDYDDSSWSGPGPGLLWVDVRATGPNPDVQPKGAEMPYDANTVFPFPTYYFRTHFPIPALAANPSLLISGYIDDGAVFYLNGHEVHRLRMDEAPTPIFYDTLATGFPCEGDATCLDEFSLSGELAGHLVAGDNVLAVEVHNYNLRSADITFGLSVIDAQPLEVPALLAIVGGDGATKLSWTRGGFVLQQAESPQGIWSDVPGPVISSPYVAPITNPARFYRLRK